MGRFLTPDWDAKPVTVPYASFGDPQTLNLYAYVENGPLNRVDATGHAGLTPLDSGRINADYIADCSNIECPPEANSNGFDEVVPAFATDADKRNYEADEATGAASQGQEQAQQQNAQPAPTNPDGSPQSPGSDVPKLPDGKGPDGKPAPNDWVPVPGTGDRPTKWKPKYPIPGQSQPGASWDPDGHWDVDNGKGARTRWLPNGGGQVGHGNTSLMDRMRSITPGPILKMGAAGVIIYIIIDEGSRLYPPRNLVPVL